MSEKQETAVSDVTARMREEASILSLLNGYSHIGAVCFDCAKAAGYTPKEKVVGVWTDECGICHERKTCTDLHHGWKKKGEAK